MKHEVFEHSKHRKVTLEGYLFENIVDVHDGQIDLRTCVSLPDGFMVEIALTNIKDAPDIKVYTGEPMPGEDCPPNFLFMKDVGQLRG